MFVHGSEQRGDIRRDIRLRDCSVRQWRYCVVLRGKEEHTVDTTGWRRRCLRPETYLACRLAPRQEHTRTSTHGYGGTVDPSRCVFVGPQARFKPTNFSCPLSESCPNSKTELIIIIIINSVLIVSSQKIYDPSREHLGF